MICLAPLRLRIRVIVFRTCILLYTRVEGAFLFGTNFFGCTTFHSNPNPIESREIAQSQEKHIGSCCMKLCRGSQEAQKVATEGLLGSIWTSWREPESMEEEERRASKEDKTSNHISKPYDPRYLRNTVTVHRYCRKPWLEDRGRSGVGNES